MRTIGLSAILALVAAPALATGNNSWIHEKSAERYAQITGQAICYFVRNNGALTAGGT